MKLLFTLAFIVAVLSQSQSSLYPTLYHDNDNPQLMWDPEKGSVLGQNLTLTAQKNVTLRNETSQIGSTVFLNCDVRTLVDKKISWIRKRDNHVLTAGVNSYSSDARFSIVKDASTGQWSLQIKFLKKKDQGKYECQVSTKSGQYSHLINLRVLVPKASIEGVPDLHLESGSIIDLTCIIKNGNKSPQFIFWYRDDVMINYDTERGGIDVDTTLNDKPTSHLKISDARNTDSGNYSCTASNTEPASVSIFVSPEDSPAAIQRINSDAADFKIAGNGDVFMMIFITIKTLFTLY